VVFLLILFFYFFVVIIFYKHQAACAKMSQLIGGRDVPLRSADLLVFFGWLFAGAGAAAHSVRRG
jgi:hypothetical protein